MESIINYLSKPLYCTSDTRVAEVRYLLKKYDNDEILVLDSIEDAHPIGLIKFDDTNIDVSNLQVGDVPYDESAKELMTSLDITVTPSSSVEACLNIMRDKGLESLVVVDESGQLRGIVRKQDIIHRILH